MGVGDIVLAAPGRFHMYSLGREFSALGRLRAVHTQSWQMGTPAGVDSGRFFNDWCGAVWGRVGQKLGRSEALEESREVWARVLAGRLVDQPPGILHGWNGVMFDAFNKLSGTGWLRCVERSCPHNLFQYKMLVEEGERLGFPHHEDRGILERKVTELYQADVIAAPSSYSARSYTDPELKRKVRVNRLGSNFRYSEREGRRDGRFRILMVGNDFLRKGSHYLLEAFRLLDLADGELFIRGYIPNSYRDRIRDSRVHVVGELPADRLRALYSESDVFVQPSIDEGFGMTVLEALAYGLPVVVTENVGCRDLLNDAVSRTVPIRDPAALARAILEARNLPGERFDVARRKILEENSWSACAERMINSVYTSPPSRLPSSRSAPMPMV